MVKREPLYEVRWTGVQPRAPFLQTLNEYFVRHPTTKAQEIANIQLLYANVTGWSFSRYHLEDQLVRGVLSDEDRLKAIAILETMAPWPSDINPCGIAPDYYPLELA